MESYYLMSKCQLTVNQVAKLNSIKTILIFQRPEAYIVHQLDNEFDLDLYNSLFNGIREIIIQSENKAMTINRYLLKMLIIKTELLLSQITIKSQSSGIIMLHELESYLKTFKSIFDSLSE